MGSPFMENFFASSTAKHIYDVTLGLFKGGTWVPTPLTDPKLNKKRLSGWWADQYDAIAEYLDPNSRKQLESTRKDIVEKLDLLLSENRGGVSVGDIGMALVNSLNKLQKTLPNLYDFAEKNPRSADAVEAFRNASFSVVKGIAAVVESNQRLPQRGESFNETFNQILVRDVTASLHELVGDPPRELYISTKDGLGYLDWASSGMDFDAIYEKQAAYEETASYQLMKFISDFRSADAILTAGKIGDTPLTDDLKAKYRTERGYQMIAMAVTLQELGKREKNLAAAKAPGAGPAAELLAVAVEAMRPVLGMEARGGATNHAAGLTKLEIDKRRKAGNAAADSIRERMEKERKEQGREEERRR